MTPYDFAGLEPSDLATWITGFFSRRSPSPPGTLPPYPSLVATQTPVDWLVDADRRLVGSGENREKVRRTVVSLIADQGGPLQHPDDRDQVVGFLLLVARELGLREVAPTLAEWVRSRWLDQERAFDMGGGRMPLRRVVWSLLIGWKETSRLGPQLTRDLRNLVESREVGTAQICFRALGEVDPAEAIRAIPLTVWWPAPYWMRTVRRFLEAVGPIELLNGRYREAWRACLGPCLFDLRKDEQLREPELGRFDEFDQNRLVKVLGEVGITLDPEFETGRIRLGIADGESLDVDISAFLDRVEGVFIGVPPAARTVADLSPGPAN